jgi:hypothetical protein
MRLNKKFAKRILGSVDKGSRFSCSNGSVFSNLANLGEGIEEMSDEVFSHHVEQGRNDFSNWIRECIGDSRLADGLIGLDKNGALKKIGSRISYIERYLEKAL